MALGLANAPGQRVAFGQRRHERRLIGDGEVVSDRPLEQGLEVEREAFVQLFATRDQKEGMRAFLDKRDPEFEGR